MQMDTNKSLERVLGTVEKIHSGVAKHASLSDAVSYARWKEDPETATFLLGKLEERCNLVKKLRDLNAASGGALLLGVPADNSLAAFMAIEALAESNPGLHPILGEIAELEKLKYMVGGGTASQ